MTNTDDAVLKKVENIHTIKECYVLRELRDRFDKIKHGTLEIEMRPRTGTEGVNFSNRCEILIAPENAKYKVGSIVWVHHHLNDQKVEDRLKKEAGLNIKDNILYGRENQIWFECDKLEDLSTEGFVVFEYIEKALTKRDSGIFLIEFDKMDESGQYGKVISGDLPKDSEIVFLENREYELWDNEKMYLLIDMNHVIMVDGELNGKWYKAEEPDAYDFYKEHKISFTKGKFKKLENPNLEYDGKHAMVKVIRKQPFVNHREVEAILSLGDS